MFWFDSQSKGIQLLLLILSFFVSIYTIIGLNSKANLIRKNTQYLIWFLSIGSFTILLRYIFLLFLYTTSENFLDHAEPSISNVSWLF